MKALFEQLHSPNESVLRFFHLLEKPLCTYIVCSYGKLQGPSVFKDSLEVSSAASFTLLSQCNNFFPPIFSWLRTDAFYSAELTILLLSVP